MKCLCGRWHKGKRDQERSHELSRAQKERDLYRARAIDEVMDHHGVPRGQAVFEVDLDMERNLYGVRDMRRGTVRP